VELEAVELDDDAPFITDELVVEPIGTRSSRKVRLWRDTIRDARVRCWVKNPS
jgi:hypothetical protein